MRNTTIHKVRAVVVNPNGAAYGITSTKQGHVLQLIGGGIKSGETRRQAILRELAEEAGFTKATILRRTKRITFNRENGTTEVTTTYYVKVAGKARKTAMTGREAKRGLRVTKFKSVKALRKALKAKAREYGRTAVLRDLNLLQAATA
jgi:ADP-ribose pyrophosphatase YjhB (NUDIX family)